MSALLQRVDYKIQLKNNTYSGVNEMIKYKPEFIKETEAIIAGEHIRIPNDMNLLEYILSLPDDDDYE
ncbi:MAG TPA: hypothetical protein VIK14_02765 [Ignavibacteria bacterium]